MGILSHKPFLVKCVITHFLRQRDLNDENKAEFEEFVGVDGSFGGVDE